MSGVISLCATGQYTTNLLADPKKGGAAPNHILTWSYTYLVHIYAKIWLIGFREKIWCVVEVLGDFT